MMSRHLEEVYTQREGTSQVKFASGRWVRSLAAAGAVLLGCGLVATRASAQQIGPQPSQAHAAPAARTTPATPAATEAPDVPASPIVTYVNGRLTIFAENATLSQVLTLLHNTMGTEVDIPAGSASERVWAHIGPGSAHKVLSELLANTDLDYILQGSPSDPNAIQTLTLSVRSQEAPKNGPAGVQSASEPRNPRFVHNPVPAPAAEPEPEPAPQEASAAVAPPSGGPAPGAPEPSGSAAQPGTADSSSAAASSAPASTASSTTEPSTSMPAPVQASMDPTGPSNVYPQTPQPSAAGFNPHPTPPPNMSSDQMVQQLTNMYQQRRQMQSGQSSSSTPN